MLIALKGLEIYNERNKEDKVYLFDNLFEGIQLKDQYPTTNECVSEE